MKIGISNDHAGVFLKHKIVEYLKNKGNVEVVDYGTNSTDSVDYPDFAKAVCFDIQKNKLNKAIVICGTGVGISISANKIKGIRCALCHETFTAFYSRVHNDANVLALGARVTGDGLAIQIVETWLNTEFEGGRHSKRVDKIMQLEKLDEN